MLEVRATFPSASVSATPDLEGGVFVIIDIVDLGDLYASPESWIGFHISYLHPATDVYPHYVRPDLLRRDGKPLGAGFSQTVWAFGNTQSTQISRRSTRRDPRLDSPALKALKVVAWIKDPS